jgi:hypothetical protein
MKTAPESFGFGGQNDWPLKVPSKGKIYGEPALSEWRKDNPNKSAWFRTPEAAQKWVDKKYRQLVMDGKI